MENEKGVVREPLNNPRARIVRLLQTSSAQILDSECLVVADTAATFAAIISRAIQTTPLDYLECYIEFSTQSGEHFALRNAADRIPAPLFSRYLYLEAVTANTSSIHGAISTKAKAVKSNGSSILNVLLVKNAACPFDISFTQVQNLSAYNVRYNVFLPNKCLRSVLIKGGDNLVYMTKVAEKRIEVTIYDLSGSSLGI